MEIVQFDAKKFAKYKEQLYKQWFEFADEDGDGRITGHDAVIFLARSNLSRAELKTVWALADSKRQGFLGFNEFTIAMHLVSLAQTGNTIIPETLKTAQVETVSPPEMAGLEELLSLRASAKAQDKSIKSAQWFKSKSRHGALPLPSVTSIIDGLKKLYIEKLKPLEVVYNFTEFGSPLLTDTDFDAKPMVMLLGQYSTGKTTFIKHLLGANYSGAHIGPEPTTDRFVVVMSGSDDRSIPGNAIAVRADMPFSGLSRFGTTFLSKFECSQMAHPLLEHISFVDTPGVLSGEKQRTQRSYDFTGVISWLAMKCDLILLLFDPHKLDISDEFKRVIESLRGQEDKIRVVLNKADQVDTLHLMKVYGALMWSLGKVLNVPEVVRVYIGSSNIFDEPNNVEAAGADDHDMGLLGRNLIQKEREELLADLKDIPRKTCDRRINEFVKRARAAQIHAHIIDQLKKKMPALIGKAKAQQRLIDNLEYEFSELQNQLNLTAGDFPNVQQFRDVLKRCSIDKFDRLKPKMIRSVDEMLGIDIPQLLRRFGNPYD
eukprot:Gb_07601 [translate_table: standard]